MTINRMTTVGLSGPGKLETHVFARLLHCPPTAALRRSWLSGPPANQKTLLFVSANDGTEPHPRIPKIPRDLFPFLSVYTFGYDPAHNLSQYQVFNV